MVSTRSQNNWKRGSGATTRLLELLCALLHQFCEYFGMVICQIGEKLSINLDAGFCEGAHEARVRRAIFAGGGIDADDPEFPELALLYAPVAKRELAGFIDVMFGNGKNIATHAPIAFGGCKDFLSAALGLG